MTLPEYQQLITQAATDPAKLVENLTTIGDNLATDLAEKQATEAQLTTVQGHLEEARQFNIKAFLRAEPTGNQSKPPDEAFFTPGGASEDLSKYITEGIQ